MKEKSVQMQLKWSKGRVTFMCLELTHVFNLTAQEAFEKEKKENEAYLGP